MFASLRRAPYSDGRIKRGGGKRWDDRKHERKWDRRRSEMKVPVLSSLILFHARQAGGGYHSLLPSGGGPRTHTGEEIRRWRVVDDVVTRVVRQRF